MGIILCTLSHVLHASEKFALCLAAAGLVTCLVFTITMMLVLGIGLGYNYCFVDFKTRHRYSKQHFYLFSSSSVMSWFHFRGSCLPYMFGLRFVWFKRMGHNPPHRPNAD
ncbi:unnamed protein product [Diatraea saccharalis]|uniref:Uncharacterized protein n=1 Tax=Diatraea saccharalis TaxID=40085 RepID=A0A9N9R057_9NEOP|nr:unnamed protein product [Diatraea saccharalis]